jgi:hypothetical protein
MPNTPLGRKDTRSPGWNMSQERAFLETLLGQRFNFFLVFFGLVVAGALNAKTQFYFQAILYLGTFICWCLACTLARSQQKLDLIIKELSRDSTHPVRIIDDRCGWIPSMRRMIGYVIPPVCCAALTCVALGACHGSLKVPLEPKSQSEPIGQPRLRQADKLTEIRSNTGSLFVLSERCSPPSHDGIIPFLLRQ